MALASGARLDVYEVVGLLGVGGMGEVYRALDTRLDRQVAIKVLPEAVRTDPERVARFEREAKLLASLNHSNIAGIYGFEQANGEQFIVMELVDGETLADRIERGAIPVEDALRIAKQIAEALEAAHDAGIIHRDLKPANIKLRPDGTVKVLDFGLAKALEPASATASPASVTESPTLTSPLNVTGVGVLLGTAAYMSPEQARGRAVDKRTDIWAFGCVLYEMVTGRRAFDGEDVTETLAAIVRGEPDWQALPRATPPSLSRVLRRAIAKDRTRRLADMRDARMDLDDATHETVAPPVASVSRFSGPRLALAATAIALVATVATSLIWWWIRPIPARAVVMRVTVPLPAGNRFTSVAYAVVALSPDGARMVFVANNRLYLREMSDLTPRPINGAETSPGSVLGHPVFSPDGQWLAYYTAPSGAAVGMIRRIPVGGGAPMTIVDNVRFTGMSWDTTGIVFSQEGDGIRRVSPDGGTAEVLVTVEKTELAQGPRLLPGGKAVLFTVSPALAFANNTDMWDKSDIVVQPVGSNERTRLIQGGSDARYLSTGHIVYARSDHLWAVPFDLDSLTVTGSPLTVVEGVTRGIGTIGAAQASLSDTGVLAYARGLTPAGRYELVFVDRKGVVSRLPLPGGLFPRISPDGKQLAFGTDDGKDARLWIYDLAGATATRQLTFEGRNRYPLWSSDGVHVVFQSDRDGQPSIYRQRADGSATAERLTIAEEGAAHVPEAASSDGRHLLFNVTQEDRHQLWLLSIDDRETTQLIDRPSRFPFASTFAPDGKWFAYCLRPLGSSGDVGSTEIFVEPFPRTGAVYRVSNGLRPLWSRDGTELFFNRPGQSFVVRISTTPTVSFGNPVEIPIPRSPPFGLLEREYDVTPDGQRFIFSVPQGRFASEDHRIELVLNWFEELRQRVPVPP